MELMSMTCKSCGGQLNVENRGGGGGRMSLLP